MFSGRSFMISADKVLTEVQLSKLFKRLKSEKDRSLTIISNTSQSKPMEARSIIDFYLFSLIANTGLRVSEALKLTWEDVHEDFLVVQASNSKNSKKGTVYFGPKTQKLLEELKSLKSIQLHRTHTTLLFSLSGKKPSRSYAHTRFKEWLKLCGLPLTFSIHSLRHTYGTQCLDNGLSLTFVRDQLRHSNISITSQYLHLTKKNRDKVKDLF